MNGLCECGCGNQRGLSTKLNRETVERIREMVASKNQSIRSIARDFGVNHKLVMLIRDRAIWK